MATDKQEAASRATGAFSRGPKTPAVLNPGSKARSARSQFIPGLLAQAVLRKGKSHDDQEMRPDRQFFRSSGPYIRLRDFSANRTWEVQQNTTIPIPRNLKPNLANLKPIPASLIPNPGKLASRD
jgi:hypothetical protein